MFRAYNKEVAEDQAELLQEGIVLMCNADRRQDEHIKESVGKVTAHWLHKKYLEEVVPFEKSE